MYRFHYDVMLARYGLNCRLLFTDTDSFCYSIQTNDLYDDMTTFLDHLDTSSYPKDHPLYTSQNAKVLGKFKNECNGITPVEFVGLHSKMYSLLVLRGHKKWLQKALKNPTFNNTWPRHVFYTLYKIKPVLSLDFWTSSHETTQYTLNKLIKSAFRPMMTNDTSWWMASRRWHTDTIASCRCDILILTNWWFFYVPSVLWHCWLGGRKGIRPVKKTE